MAVRTFARVTNRVETGAIQFGDDWAGLFLRGDDAKFLSMSIESLIGQVPDTLPNKIAKMHLVHVKEMIDKDVEQKSKEQREARVM